MTAAPVREILANGAARSDRASATALAGGSVDRPAPEEQAMSRYADALRWLGIQEWFPRVYKPLFPKLDRWLYRRSGGRLMATGPRMFPTLLLTTTGHESGKRRTTPVFYVEDGDSIVVAATNFGLRDHPAWSENLLHNASAEVQIGDVTRQFRARPASSDEVARAWPRLVALWPAFNRYKERSGREIRIFVLDPR